MPDFNNLKPEKNITDPKNLGAVTDYPQTLYRATPTPTDTSLIVAWKGKTPVHNELDSAVDDADKANKIKDGWSLAPVVEDAKAKK